MTTTTAIVSNDLIANLLQSDEEQLFETLGMRTAVIGKDLSRSTDVQLDVSLTDLKAMGVKDDLKALGKRIFRRWNRSAYELACGGDPDDAKTRSDLTKALGLSEAAAIGVLTGGLISIGLMAALAPVVATLLVKKFFNPAYGEFCDFWHEKLEA